MDIIRIYRWKITEKWTQYIYLLIINLMQWYVYKKKLFNALFDKVVEHLESKTQR